MSRRNQFSIRNNFAQKLKFKNYNFFNILISIVFIILLISYEPFYTCHALNSVTEIYFYLFSFLFTIFLLQIMDKPLVHFHMFVIIYIMFS